MAVCKFHPAGDLWRRASVASVLEAVRRHVQLLDVHQRFKGKCEIKRVENPKQGVGGKDLFEMGVWQRRIDREEPCLPTDIARLFDPPAIFIFARAHDLRPVNQPGARGWRRSSREEHPLSWFERTRERCPVLPEVAHGGMACRSVRRMVAYADGEHFVACFMDVELEKAGRP